MLPLHQMFSILILLVAVPITCVSSLAAKSTASKPPSHSQQRKQQVPIIACSSSIELQRAISFYIRSKDCVLELGAQLSDSSKHLCRTIHDGKAVLVDVKRSDAKSGRCCTRDVSPFLESGIEGKESFVDMVHFMELEQLDDWRKKLFQDGSARENYDVIILDVGAMIGNDLHLTTLSLAIQLLSAQGDKTPRVVLVKSKALSTWARRLVHAQRLLDGTAVLPPVMERSHKPSIIASVGVDEYRRTVPHIVRKGDAVIEVGCHSGRTTKILHDAAKKKDGSSGCCIGVDIGPGIIENAKKQYPDVPFVVADAWRTLDLLKMKDRFLPPVEETNNYLGFDVVYADIGGLSGADGYLESLALLDALGHGLESRDVLSSRVSV